MSELWLDSCVRSGRWLARAAAFGVCALLAAPAPAQQPPQGNAQQGKIIGYTCLGCHGIKGYRNAYPDYAVPRLRGQSVTYLVSALQEYRDGQRAYPTMHLQALSLSAQQMADVAAYLGGNPVTAKPVPGAAVPAAAQVCASCHGSNGIGVAPMYPTLAGQHESYLIRVLHEYQSGYRQSPIMDGIAHSLTNAQIRTVAAYFSHLKPGLHTVPRPYTRWSGH